MLLKGYDSATAKTKANVDGAWGLGECWNAGVLMDGQGRQSWLGRKGCWGLVGEASLRGWVLVLSWPQPA